MMIHQPISKPSIPFPIASITKTQSSRFSSQLKIQCESIDMIKPPFSLQKQQEKNKQQMGPYTGRDPNVKKPGWLRQKAPQGQRFQQVKESLSTLKLNTVCEEAQCPNIGEVCFSFLFPLSISWGSLNMLRMSFFLIMFSFSCLD